MKLILEDLNGKSRNELWSSDTDEILDVAKSRKLYGVITVSGITMQIVDTDVYSHVWEKINGNVYNKIF